MILGVLASTGQMPVETNEDLSKFTPSGPAGQFSFKKHLIMASDNMASQGELHGQTNQFCWLVTAKVKGANPACLDKVGLEVYELFNKFVNFVL